VKLPFNAPKSNWATERLEALPFMVRLRISPAGRSTIGRRKDGADHPARSPIFLAQKPPTITDSSDPSGRAKHIETIILRRNQGHRKNKNSRRLSSASVTTDCALVDGFHDL
jgi:hypothetical protein